MSCFVETFVLFLYSALSLTINFRLPEIQSICNSLTNPESSQTNLDSLIGLKKKVEKGENTGFFHFLLFPAMFSEVFYLMVVNPLPDDKF